MVVRSVSFATARFSASTYWVTITRFISAASRLSSFSFSVMYWLLNIPLMVMPKRNIISNIMAKYVLSMRENNVLNDFLPIRPPPLSHIT